MSTKASDKHDWTIKFFYYRINNGCELFTSGLRYPGVPAKPNHACWSPCTSMASPKSASFTAAPFSLLASKRFSG